MTERERFFRAAGYAFTWSDEADGRASVAMYRESASGRGRYFVARARCAPGREAAYARALAMVAWVKSLGVPARRDPKAQAVLEMLAVTNDRLARLQAKAPAASIAVGDFIEGRAAAA